MGKKSNAAQSEASWIWAQYRTIGPASALVWLSEQLDQNVANVADVRDRLMGMAVDDRDLNAVALLHEKGAKISLSAATSLSQDIAFVARLIAMGAEVDDLTAGDSPLNQAVLCHSTELISLLLDEGASIDLGSASGTPLILAAKLGDRACVELLLERGADPACIYDDDTAEMAAQRAGYQDLAVLLATPRTNP